MVRKPDLLFPDHPPPGMTTHYAGRWELNPDNKRVWIQYHQTLDADELPSNVSNDPIHWLGRRYPGDQFLTINGDFIHAEGAPSSNYRRTITPHTTGLTPTTAYTETPGAGHGGDEPTSMYANVRGTPIISGTSPLQRLNKMNPNKRGDPGDFGGTGYFGDQHGGKQPFGGGSGDPGGDWDPDGYGGASYGRQPTPFPFKPFTPKPDITAYQPLTTNKIFPTWYKHFLGTARAHGFWNLFDVNYTPKTQAEIIDYKNRNAYFYSIFQKIIKTTNGEVIVQEHFHDVDCFAILLKLVEDAQTSVAGTLESVENLNWLTSVLEAPSPLILLQYY